VVKKPQVDNGDSYRGFLSTEGGFLGNTDTLKFRLTGVRNRKMVGSMCYGNVKVDTDKDTSGR